MRFNTIFKSKLTWILGGISLAFLLTILVIQARGFLGFAKMQVQKKIESVLMNRQVRLGKLSTNLLHSVSLSNLEVSNQGGFQNGVFLKVEKIKLRFYFGKILPIISQQLLGERKEISESLKELAQTEIIRPSLFLSRKEGNWNLAEIGEGDVMAAPITILWKEGKIFITDDLEKLNGLEFKNCSGSLRGGVELPSFDCSLETSQNEKFLIKLQADSTRSFKAECLSENLQIENLLSRFKLFPPPTSPTPNHWSSIVPNYYRFTGGLDSTMQISGPLPFDWRKKDQWRYGGTSKLKNLNCVLSYANQVNTQTLALNGEIKFTTEKVETESLTIKTSSSEVKVSGTLFSPLKDPKIQAQILGKVEMQEWNRFSPQGISKLSLKCIGELKNPTLEGSLEISESTFVHRPLVSKINLHYSSSTLKVQSLSTSWGNGKIEMEGLFSNKKMVWNAQLKNGSLQHLFKDKRFKTDGQLSFQLAGSGTFQKPKMEGTIQAKNFSWMEDRIGTLSGQINATNNIFKIFLSSLDKKNRFYTEIEKREESLHLKECKLILLDGENITIAGDLDQNSKKLIGTINANSVPTSKVAPFVKFLSHFDGKLFLKCELKGTFQEPTLKGQLEGKKLSLKTERLKEDGITKFYDLRSNLEWNQTIFQLSPILLGASYKGSFSYQRKPKSKFTIQVNANDGDPKILLAILNSPANISGKLNGFLSMIRQRNPNLIQKELAWEGNGNLHLLNGRWGETLFEKGELKYHFDKTKLQIEKLSFKQKEGSLSAQIKSEQTQEKNPLEITVTMKNFLVGKNRLDGDFSSKGDFFIQSKEWFQGSVKSNNFTMNGFGAGTLKGVMELKERILTVKSFSWGDFFKGNCQIFFGQKGSPKIRGNWYSIEKEIKEWNKILQLGHWPLQGFFSLSGTVLGTLSDMNFSFYSTFSDLKPDRKKTNENRQNELGVGEGGVGGGGGGGWYGNGKTILSKGILKSLSLKMMTHEGGKLTLLGQANLKSRELNLEAFFNQMDFKPFLEMVGWNALEGKISGRLTILGNSASPIVKGELKGTSTVLGSLPLESWDLSGTFQEKEISFSRLNLLGKKGSWRFSILEDSWIRSMEGGEKGSFRLAADFANISLGPVFFVGNGMTEGIWERSGKSIPSLEGIVKINQWFANNADLKPLTLKVQIQDQNLKLLPYRSPTLPNQKEDSEENITVRGEIDFSKTPCVLFKQLTVSDLGSRTFFIDGTVCPKKPSFQMEGNGVDGSFLSGILNSPITFSGKTHFRAQGFADNGSSQIKGELILKNGKAEEIPVDELHSKFQWREGLFTLSSLRAQTKALYTISADGYFPLKWGEMKSLNPKVKLALQLSDVKLSLLNFFESDLAKNGKGSFNANLTIHGKPEDPIVDGRLKISDGELNSLYFTRKVKDLNAHVQVKSNKILFERFEWAVGEGKAKISGQTHCSLEGGVLTFDNFNLSLQTLSEKKGIPIQIPEFPAVKGKLGLPSTPSRGSPLFSVQLSGKREKPKLSGWIKLDHALFSYPPAEKVGSDDSWTDKIDWDLKLKTGGETIFQNDFAYAKVNGEISFKGTGDDLLINGQLYSNEGTISIYGAKFNLQEAILEISQPASLTLENGTVPPTELKNVPYLQFKAEQNTFVDSIQGGQKISDTISIQLERTPLTEKFDPKKLTFRSAQNPNASSEKVAIRSGIGINLEAATPEERAIQLRQGVARLIDSQLVSPLARSILQRSGLVQRIEVNQETTGGRSPELRGTERSLIDPLIGQSILVERTVGKNLGVGYKATFDKIKDRIDFIHQIQLRYPFYKGFWIYGSTELDSRENLGRDPESKGGVQWGIKFDPANLFRKNGEKK